MGWAERCNPKSEWNRKRTMNMSSEIASPITTAPIATKATTPVKQDEPMVIQITPKSIFTLFKEFLCRILSLFKKQQTSPAPINS